MYAKTNTVVSATIVSSALFVYIFSYKLAQTYLVEWFIAILILSILRYFVYLFFKKRKNDDSIKLWGDLFLGMSFLISGLWGTAWFIVSSANDLFSLAIISMFIMGITAISFSIYSIYMKAILLYFLPIVILGMINFIYKGGEYGYSFALAILVYSIVILRVSIPITQYIKDAITIKYKLEDEIAQRKKIENKLLEMSIVDSLTGLYNRRYFDEKIYAQLHSAQRTSLSTSLIIIDIDSFKLYNDNYGHLEGDTCLHKVSQAIKKTLNREEDLTFRYGGEEIAVLLPNTKLEDALVIAQRIQENVLKLSIEHLYSGVNGVDVISVSSGVASLVPEKNSVYTTLVKEADNALYEAKRAGKNRVCPTSSTKSSSCEHSVHNKV